MSPTTSRQGIVLVATPCQLATARILGKLRTRGHDHTRKPSEDKGKQGNLIADSFAVLAEILVYDALERAGLRPEGYELVADRPPSGSDFALDQTQYDIKTCLPEKHFLCINEGQFQDNAKRPDFYLPAVFVTPRKLALCKPIPAGSVSDWRLMNNGHSPYRSIHRRELTPLPSLPDLTSRSE